MNIDAANRDDRNGEPAHGLPIKRKRCVYCIGLCGGWEGGAECDIVRARSFRRDRPVEIVVAGNTDELAGQPRASSYHVVIIFAQMHAVRMGGESKFDRVI